MLREIEKAGGKARKESEREKKPWRETLEAISILFSNFLPRLSPPASYQMPAGTEQTSTEQFYLDNSFLVYIY